MTTSTWILIAVLVLSLPVLIVVLKGVRKEDSTGKWITRIIIAWGFLFILHLALHWRDIRPAEWAQIILMLGLVAVTLIYAMSAIRQANASEKMAKEMENQRYDTVRPVIDIQWQPDAKEEELVRAAGVMAIEGGEPPQSQLPDKLTCVLRNVGVGTATDVYSFIQAGTQPDDECHQLRPLCLLQINGVSEEWPLSLKEIDNHKFLVAYYRDVHNRCFQSIREVSRDEKRGNLKLDPLGTSKLDKEVYRELNVGNYTGFLEKLWSPSKEEVNHND